MKKRLDNRIFECALICHAREQAPTYVLTANAWDSYPIFYLVHGLFNAISSPMHVQGFPEVVTSPSIEYRKDKPIKHACKILRRFHNCKCFAINYELKHNKRLRNLCHENLRQGSLLDNLYNSFLNAKKTFLVINEDLEPHWKEKYMIQLDMMNAVE